MSAPFIKTKANVTKKILEAYKTPNKPLQQVSLTHERMICYYSDLYRDNFPVERQPRDPIPWGYRKGIPIERTGNLRAMRTASWWFGIGCGWLLLGFPGFVVLWFADWAVRY